ncbi:MAG: TetR family transcriptional regulator, partial [Candidatus Dormibacteraceae bacterium]
MPVTPPRGSTPSPARNAAASGLSRPGVVAAALEVIDQGGLDHLSMRSLADHLQVKAASIYWHVRDRRELLELVAAAVLAEAHPPDGKLAWRAWSLRSCDVLASTLSGHRDSARIVLGIPNALEQSDLHLALWHRLQTAGLEESAAAEAALLMLTHVATMGARERPASPKPGIVARLAINSGTRGVTVRAGAGIEGLVRAAPDATASAASVVEGQTVLVRRRRGVSRGLIEINPSVPWEVKIHGGTWNT